jgi:hypothetical protein
MRTSVICSFLALALVSTAGAQALGPADREALLDRLEKMREDAKARNEARFKNAIGAYTSAAGSDDATIDLYLKCVQKVDFEDQQKKESEFREWKRKESDKLSEPARGVALRLQLRWLVLTLRAATIKKAEREQMIPSVQEIIDVIGRDAVRLKDQHNTLNQAVTSSVFARAYEIGGVDVEDWPLAPGNISEIYEKILLPPLRRPDRLESLRSAWIRRIQQEIAIEQASGQEEDPPNRRNGGGEHRQRGYQNFMENTVPELQWQMEMDLFRNGDQQGAAMRMITHLEKYITHKSARKWSDELRNILNPAQPPPAP